MPRAKKPRGRPVKHPRPQMIDASPEEISEAVLRAKPRKMWRFEQEAENKRKQSRTESAP